METAITWSLFVLCWGAFVLTAFVLLLGVLDACLMAILWAVGLFKEKRSVPKETTSAEAQKFER